MKIAIGANLQKGPWGGGNQFLSNLTAYLEAEGVEVCFELKDDDIDLILLTEVRKELKSCAFNDADIEKYLRDVNANAIVVHRINECDERKDTRGVNQRILWANKQADHTIFVSAWLQSLYEKQGWDPSKGGSVILNGANKDIFDGASYQLWDGTSPLKLVTHHWGNDWRKGFDIYTRLDWMLGQPGWKGRFEFSYIGRLPDALSLKNSSHVQPLYGRELSQELQKYHVYVTASENEPGSNHQNEGACCGLPILYLHQGSMPEYCEGFGVSYTKDNFSEKLEEMARDYKQHQQKISSYPFIDIRSCEQYLSLFKKLIDKPEKRSREKIKLIASEHEKLKDWMLELPPKIVGFVDSLEKRGKLGAYQICQKGLTEMGEKITLPFSCFALKIFYMLGQWEQMDKARKDALIAHIKSFQAIGYNRSEKFGKFAFIDPNLIRQIDRYPYITRRFLSACKQTLLRTDRNLLFLARQIQAMNPCDIAIISESKQVLASLLQVGEHADQVYNPFGRNEDEILKTWNSLNWVEPWVAGAHAAIMMMVISTQIRDEAVTQKLQNLLYGKLEEFVDPQSGSYFSGENVHYDQLVNGAMKVLTGLEWLDKEIHYPERLIDTVLSGVPRSEGCHLVDAIYVLYRCGLQSYYRKEEVQDYCLLLLPILKEHYRESGGFSYYLHQAQTSFLSAKVSHGYDEADLHGTSLLTWACSMLMKILEWPGHDKWKVLKS